MACQPRPNDVDIWAGGRGESNQPSTRLRSPAGPRIWISRRRCSRCLGRIYATSKQATRARESFGRALHLYRRLDQPGEVIAILSALANLALSPDCRSKPKRCMPKRSGLPPTATDHSQVAKLHGKLGRLAQRRGEITAWLDHLRRAVEHAGQAGRPALLSKAVQHYAAALHAAHDPEAIEAYQIAIAQTRDLNDLSGEALMRLNLGTLLTSQGNLDEGMDHLYAASAPCPELRRRRLDPAPAHRRGHREHRGTTVPGRSGFPSA